MAAEVSTDAPVSAGDPACAVLKSIFPGVMLGWSLIMLNVLFTFSSFFGGAVGRMAMITFSEKLFAFYLLLLFFLFLVPLLVLILNRLLANPPSFCFLKPLSFSPPVLLL